MPSAERGGAAGVLLRLVPARLRATTPLTVPRADTGAAPRPVRVHDADFRTQHRGMAASRPMSCAGCHAQRFCSECHAGETPRRFHRANFVQQHASASYNRDTQCASCHNTQLFCRSCHQTAGVASSGRLDAAYHNAQPQWLLQHGRAARQGLQSCAACHAQRDCMTCHATTGWGVNPHGRGFDAARMAARNGPQCLLCHLQIPGRR
jgi:hypothetical protein